MLPQSSPTRLICQTNRVGELLSTFKNTTPNFQALTSLIFLISGYFNKLKEQL